MNHANFTIRRTLPADLDANLLDDLLLLERGIAEAPHWPRSVYEAILSRSAQNDSVGRQIFVASAGQALVGFSVTSLSVTAPELPGSGCCSLAELETVVVAPSARRRGVGRTLCQAVLDWCRDLGAAEIMLEVRSASSAPIALYSSLGFELTGCRPGYYADPPDAALGMRLQLRPRST
jgi:ribosomal-protein-alanine N-acetyltransferase